MATFWCIAALIAASIASDLVDHPVTGDKQTILDGTWTLSAPTAAIKTTGEVPGDLLTDLEQNGFIGDPLYELNFLNHSLWTDHAWTYSTTFSHDASGAAALLVFDGIKMGANITLNGHFVGLAVDQFLRYQFDVTKLLVAGTNELSVTFDFDIQVDGRFMACTGGWDWAPYTGTNQNGANTFSQGIWKSVYLVDVSTAVITHAVPHTFYNGEYPVTRLVEHQHGGFDVRATFHTWAPSSTIGTLSVTSAFGSVKQQVTLPQGNTSHSVNFTAAASDIELWWPTGTGSQVLYNLTFEFLPDSGQAVSTTRRIGFRTFALVTGNDTDPAYVAKNKDADGNDHQGMLWRINGMVIFSKGANMIPMEELEGRMSADAHRQLVVNARDGGMNTLRVWGGGIFFPDVWYDACDELGIMIYHDMAYAQKGHAPSNDVVQDAELRHQIRRISHHPSIVMYDGCNECKVVLNTATGIYATFVMTVVAQEDKSRVIWPSCPAAGWDAGVNRLTGIPNDSPKGLLPAGTLPYNPPSVTNSGHQTFMASGPPIRETHGPYQHGSGFPAMDGKGPLQPFGPNIPINIKAINTGPQLENVFASEFGCVVMSSFESMAPTLAPEHWGVHGGAPPDDCRPSVGNGETCNGTNVMAQRNYPCDSVIYAYFGYHQDLNASGEDAFKKQLYQCMLGQALEIKSNIETRRSTNQFGIIVWQFNEIWPTGGWGSIEYGSARKGQVVGGRWKPLQYFYRNSIYTDVTVACSHSLCYVKNDSPFPFQGRVTVDIVEFDSGATASLYNQTLDMATGAGVTTFFSIDTSDYDASKHVMVGKIYNSTAGSDELVCDNVIAMTPPVNMSLPSASVNFTISDGINEDGSVDITVTSDRVAMYVTLTTLAQGRFSDNAFIMMPGKKDIQFLPFKNFGITDLKTTLRIEHLAPNL